MQPAEIIEWIVRKLAASDFQLRLHSLTRISERGFQPQDIRNALLTGKVIEDYPNDRRGHSFLIWGKSTTGKDLHVVCGITDDILWIITVYEPTPDRWETAERRKHHDLL